MMILIEEIVASPPKTQRRKETKFTSMECKRQRSSKMCLGVLLGCCLGLQHLILPPITPQGVYVHCSLMFFFLYQLRGKKKGLQYSLTTPQSRTMAADFLVTT